MGSIRDKAGRPIVVVTGGGLVTSLGAGKSDNWRRLTAGESGIREITRFGTEGLRTKVAGTVDFIPLDPYSAPALSERLAELAAEEAIAQSRLGSRGHFPGPLFLAVAPVEIEWPQREVLADGSGATETVSCLPDNDIVTGTDITLSVLPVSLMAPSMLVRSLPMTCAAPLTIACGV